MSSLILVVPYNNPVRFRYYYYFYFADEETQVFLSSPLMPLTSVHNSYMSSNGMVRETKAWGLSLTGEVRGQGR